MERGCLETTHWEGGEEIQNRDVEENYERYDSSQGEEGFTIHETKGNGESCGKKKCGKDFGQ